MPLRYLLDENVSHVLWKAVQRHNLRTAWSPIDVARVGDAQDLPLGSQDPAILIWAQREDRVFISQDRGTLARHLAAHIAAGHRYPGIIFPRKVPLVELVDFLACAAYASEPHEWENRTTFVP